MKTALWEPDHPRESFSCDESDTDILTVAASDYDPEALYITATEHNDAGVMTHHVGFFMNPGKALRLAERIKAEATAKGAK